MDKFLENNVNSAYTLSRLHEEDEIKKQIAKAEEMQKIQMQNAPLVKELQNILSETQNQNKMLSEQIDSLNEQNKLLKSMYDSAKTEAEESRKQAKNDKLFGWISFAVGTIIGLAGVLIGIFF